jgi:transposase
LYGDRAYHSHEGGRELRRRGIQAKIARPKSPRGSGLGTKRWVVERTIAGLHQYRRLRIRYERRDDIHEAFVAIGCSLICFKLLRAEESFC